MKDRLEDRLEVALIRGEALNPYELQVYARLPPNVDVLAVGRKHPLHEVGAIDVPTRLLFSPSQHRGIKRLQSHVPLPQRLAPDRLVGLRRAVSGRQILHAAETVLPVTEQAAEIAGLSGSKLVLTCWETIPFRYDDDPVLAERKVKVKRVAAHYIAVTERARAALVEEGVAPSQITVVPAGVDGTRFVPQPASAELLRQWGVPVGARVVLYVGRLIQEKGVVELVRAFAGVPGEPHLVLVGAGNQQRRVRIAASALGIAERVHVQSASAYGDLPRAYASADVVVAPSLTTPYWEEQFGMVLVEALSSARPLVTTRSGAIPEVVGDAAVLVDPYSVEQLRAALHHLLRDDQARAALSLRARRWAEEHYSLPIVANQIAAVYSRVSRS